LANLAYYKERLGISTEDGAFAKFISTLANHHSASYYVDWEKVLAKAGKFGDDFALLSTLCGSEDIETAAIDLFMRHPRVIRALPTLIAHRHELSLVGSSGDSGVTNYSFLPKDATGAAKLAEAKRYAHFLVEIGLGEVLERLKSVSDYAIGVEVGLDSNGRKNRGGACGVEAIMPAIAAARGIIADLEVTEEATYADLKRRGFRLPDSCRGVVWDASFWLRGSERLVVMEVNHYASAGSKPPAIAREYTARNADLRAAGVGFIWVTDGLGWKKMQNPLRSAFEEIDYLMNIALASEGELEFALRALLRPT